MSLSKQLERKKKLYTLLAHQTFCLVRNVRKHLNEHSQNCYIELRGTTTTTKSAVSRQRRSKKLPWKTTPQVLRPSTSPFGMHSSSGRCNQGLALASGPGFGRSPKVVMTTPSQVGSTAQHSTAVAKGRAAPGRGEDGSGPGRGGPGARSPNGRAGSGGGARSSPKMAASPDRAARAAAGLGAAGCR